MTRIIRATEYRFVIPGPAISFRSPKSGSYKRLVRRIAKGVFPSRVSSLPQVVFLDYFHRSRRRVDVDNVAKCVLDALNGLAYKDDQQVRVQATEAHDLRESFILPVGPVDLIKPLRSYPEYLFVRVRL